MTRLRTIIALALAVTLVAAAGCSLGVRKAGSVVTGKKDSVGIIGGYNESFTEYSQITVTHFSSDFAEAESLLGHLHSEALRQLQESKLFENVNGTDDGIAEDMLVVRGRIIDYNAGEKWKRIATIGGEAFVIVRFRIEDMDGKLLAEFNSRGFVKDALTGGDIKDTAPLICSGLTNFLKDRIVREGEARN